RRGSRVPWGFVPPATRGWPRRPRMPPPRFTRSVHHSVPRRPAWPTGAVTPARLARTPILTGSAGTPGRTCPRAGRGRARIPPVASATPLVFRNSRLVAGMCAPSWVDGSGDEDEPLHETSCRPVDGDRLGDGDAIEPGLDGGGDRQHP